MKVFCFTYRIHLKIVIVLDEISTKRIFTSELIEGIPLDKCDGMDQATRNNVCFLVMQLCLKELFEFSYMQTDPNWSNFFYNDRTKQVILFYKHFDLTTH